MSVRRWRGGLAFLVLAWWAWGCGSGPGPGLGPAPDSGAPDIRVLLAAVPGLAVVGEHGGGLPGYRRFDLTFDQPVDHGNPAGQHFRRGGLPSVEHSGAGLRRRGDAGHPV